MTQKLEKWLESEINKVGKEFQEKYAVFWHRFADSYAARGALQEQPADFLMIVPGISLLIEAKTSEKHDSLRSCASSHISPQQVGQHLLWSRTENPSIFLFYSEPAGIIEMWSGYDVACARKHGKPLSPEMDLTLSETYSKKALQGMLKKAVADY